MSNPFEELVTNFENSMRGLTKVSNTLVKAFPHTAGSVFISKMVSLMRTIVNEKSVFADLDESTVKDRIYRNGKALVVMEVLDETVEPDNMLLIFESFQNVSIDTYKGMKDKGKYGILQQKLTLQEQTEDYAEEQLIG